MPDIRVPNRVINAPYWRLNDHFLQLDGNNIDTSAAALLRAALDVPQKVATTTDHAIVRFHGTSGEMQDSGIRIDDSGQVISRTNQTGALILSGGNSSGGGANIELYGSSHGSLPGRAYYDADLHTWRDLASVTIMAANTTGVTFGSPGSGTDGKLMNASGWFEDSYRSVTTSASHYRFINPNGQVGNIFTNGSATTYNTSSDERLKENFTDFDAGAILDQIDIYQFEWKVDGTIGYGPKAQELYQVFPVAVTPGSVGDAPGDPDFTPWGWDGSKLVPLLIKDNQALRAKNAELEAKVDDLESRVAALEAIILP